MIAALSPEQAEAAIGQLAELLIDTVSSGASIGFMPPLDEEEALEYWHGVIEAMRTGSRVLLAAIDNDHTRAQCNSRSKREPMEITAPRP
jgi:hypothetical protein